jgi:HAD-superfamily hydrolase, subfamily IIB/mannosyl-3-phosphoglycerate phosphatase family
MKPQIVIFTDLDGTLLDHQSYSFTAAEPCLHYLRTNNFPLIFTSSKTAVEIEALCKLTEFNHPYIAENGGLLSIPENYFPEFKTASSSYIKSLIGTSRSEIHEVINMLSTSFKFKSFNNMSTEELISHTGLSTTQAKYANERDCTEPLLWLDDQSKLNKFATQLEKYELRLVSGGRFHHVMGHHDKATTMSTLLEMYDKQRSSKTISIALGDSPNDIGMLNTADFGIVVPNPHAPKMSIENHVSLTYAKQAGPSGWNETLLLLLRELLSD